MERINLNDYQKQIIPEIEVLEKFIKYSEDYDLLDSGECFELKNGTLYFTSDERKSSVVKWVFHAFCVAYDLGFDAGYSFTGD